ncbi:MAG: YggS family pyridoxal phosphate-dependent enzyme [Bacteroidota bacterium]|nr:YggS family pyridoxal phosphate-dependent enzyme [Bacteroidota bacterium]
MNIREKLESLHQEIPSNVKLIAVSKTKPASMIKEAFQAGQRAFGENKAKEVLEKHVLLPEETEWHFIGHLQTNKVKQIAPFIHMIQSVDSFHLLREINKEALKNNRVIPCLLEFHIATEETKSGFNRQEVTEMISSQEFSNMKNIRIAGVMGMATFTDDSSLVHKEFRDLHEHFNFLKFSYFKDDPSFCEISMGMSSDYPIAIEEGSTMVRIGSAIFGGR